MTISAQAPFHFFTAGYLTQIGNHSAETLSEFLDGLENCSDASIFHHTFQTLGTHHFLTEGFSNDFAQWVLASANRGALAERLAALDVRDYTSIAAIRSDLCNAVAEYCGEHPQFAGQTALGRFYFCESAEVTVPFAEPVDTLDAFREGVARLSHSSFYYHFVSSRLRLQLQTNDFSRWLAEGLGLDHLAQNINRIDIYTNTLDSARQKVLRLVDRERRRA